MKYLSLPITLACLFIASSASAIGQPRIIPGSARIDKPIEELYSTLKRHFSDPTLSHFQLTNADEETHTIVATRNGIDMEVWSNWAFCQAGPV
jgi:hypothetical protein